MRRFLLVLTLLAATAFLFSGCATWHGLKKMPSVPGMWQLPDLY